MWDLASWGLRPGARDCRNTKQQPRNHDKSAESNVKQSTRCPEGDFRAWGLRLDFGSRRGRDLILKGLTSVQPCSIFSICKCPEKRCSRIFDIDGQNERFLSCRCRWPQWLVLGPREGGRWGTDFPFHCAVGGASGYRARIPWRSRR